MFCFELLLLRFDSNLLKLVSPVLYGGHIGGCLLLLYFESGGRPPAKELLLSSRHRGGEDVRIPTVLE